jgi:hypothetical protein
MNPIAIIVIIAFVLLTIWAGRVGMSSIIAFFQKRIRQILGGALLIFASFLALRGVWHIAFAPAIFGWWLLSAKASISIADLFKHYFDRSLPRWRFDLHDSTNAGQASTSASSSVMTKQEAYQILGLKPSQFEGSQFQGGQVQGGQTQSSQAREVISAAYRRAMKKAHPDQGGAVDLAVRLNIARDILLS